MKALLDLFQVPIDERGQRWYDDFYGEVVKAHFVVGDPPVLVGPDQFPYLVLNFPSDDEAEKSKPLASFIDEATASGTGIVLNPKGRGADWVFSYGNLWSYRAFGSFFIAPQTGFDAGAVKIDKDTKILVGAPSETFFPSYARRVIGDYMAQTLHIANPGAAVLGPLGNAPASLAFTIFVESFPSSEDYETAMQRMTWFLPAHYVITGLPKSQEIAYTPL